jgi:hypothetical protein
VFTPFTSTTPNLYADIDRVLAAKLGVPAQRVFEALQVYLGSTYINDFNYLGRTYQVMAQADETYRLTADDIGRYKTRNDAGEMVPIGSIATFRDTAGPYRVPRYNQFPAAEVQGNAASGVSSGTALAASHRRARGPDACSKPLSGRATAASSRPRRCRLRCRHPARPMVRRPTRSDEPSVPSKRKRVLDGATARLRTLSSAARKIWWRRGWREVYSGQQACDSGNSVYVHFVRYPCTSRLSAFGQRTKPHAR